MKYRNAKRLVNGWIDCELNHPQYGWIPFTANPTDTGSFFNVGELHAKMSVDPDTKDYVPPSQEDTLKKKTISARQLRAELLDKHVDAFVMNQLRWGDMTEDQKSQIIEYRQNLLDITDQEGFPLTIIWPNPPAFAQ